MCLFFNLLTEKQLQKQRIKNQKIEYYHGVK